MATFQQGQELAQSLTEKEMAALWRTVLQTYRDVNKKINDDIAKVYAKYLTGNNPEDYYNIMIQYDRLGRLNQQIIDEYTKASKLAGVTIAKSSQLGFTNTFYREQYTLTFMSQIPMTFSIVNPAIVESSVFGTAELWKAIQTDAIKRIYGDPKQYVPRAGSLTDILSRNRMSEIEKIRSALSAGLLSGDSYRDITSTIHRIIGEELVKDGSKAYTGAKASSALIVRTEGTRNLNAGFSASLHDAKAQGLGVEKEWLTAFINSRDTHKTANRQRVELDDVFIVGQATGQFPGSMSTGKENYNCQCTHIGVIDGIEPQLQRGRNPITGESEIFSYRGFDEWAANNGLVPDEFGVLE